jgi:hypothetical protein
VSGLIAGLSTWFVVKLQRVEIEQSAIEQAQYKAEAAAEVAKANERIAELSTQAEGLKKETAVANERAAQAQLALQKLANPRFLDFESFRNSLVDITPAPSVEVLYAEACSDCWALAQMICATLGESKWPNTIGPLKSLYSPPHPLAGLPVSLQYGSNPTGISIVTKTVGDLSDKSTPALLSEALAKATGDGTRRWSRAEDMPEGAIRIVVALKI